MKPLRVCTMNGKLQFVLKHTTQVPYDLRKVAIRFKEPHLYFSMLFMTGVKRACDFPVLMV